MRLYLWFRLLIEDHKVLKDLKGAKSKGANLVITPVGMELRNEMLLGMNDVSELTLGKRSFYSLDLFFMRTARHLARNDLGNNMRMLVMSNRQSQSS